MKTQVAEKSNGGNEGGGPLVPMDEHNRRLTDQVRPAAWKNPTPSGRYNLVVLGGGPAGLVAAAGAAGLGAKVALIEKHLLGGDCLNVGCVPSKALIAAGRTAAAARGGEAFGVTTTGTVEVDFAKVMERMRRLRADLSHHDAAERFQGLGIDVYLGAGRFTGEDTVEVDGQTLRFKRAVIATGARASVPPIPGIDEVPILTNESVFSLTERPKRLLVVGAGPIGCELAQAFARLGSEVTLVDIADQILIREDPDAARIVQAALLRDGVRLHLQVNSRFERREDETIATLTSRAQTLGPSIEVVVDAVFVGAGRRPNVDGLGLEAASVAFDPRKGVVVDDRLRTTNKRIYAAGDVASRYQFTHTADAMARIVIRNALFFGRARVSALTIPWCTFTDPEVAHVGLYPRDAEEQGIAIDTFEVPLASVDRAVLEGEVEGFCKVHVRKGKDTIVGATVVACHAGDIVSELTVAMRHGVGLGGLADTIHPYPTTAEAVRKAGDAYNRTRLTAFVKRVFAAWLRWIR
ncbi:MAG: mercuric reductase [Planctomycetota bacterium]|jgi:pyruvate/2-oxoglutarate dehydrogenase complex dihydrolipoamide dehydrogenase (E3) component